MAPREMEMGATFGPEIQGDAGNLHAVLSALHDIEIGTEFCLENQSNAGNLHALLSALRTHLLRLEQQSVHYHTQPKLSPGESS